MSASLRNTVTFRDTKIQFLDDLVIYIALVLRIFVLFFYYNKISTALNKNLVYHSAYAYKSKILYLLLFAQLAKYTRNFQFQVKVRLWFINEAVCLSAMVSVACPPKLKFKIEM